MRRSPFTRRFALLATTFGLAVAPAALPAQQAVPDATNWLLFDHLPGIEGRSCMARTNSPEVDTMLAFNNDGVPLLIAGWADRYNEGGEAEVGLSIDGAAPVRLQGGIALNLVLVLIEDSTILQRLRGARTLDWTFPFGRFRANVGGLGTALEAVRACREAAPAATGTS